MGIRITNAQQRYASMQGFAEALRRLCSARGLRDSYVALAEALYWTVTIEDDLRGEDWYDERRLASGDWPLIPGIRYARNFATHQVVVLTEHSGEPDLAQELPSPLLLGDPVWLPYEELPAPGRTSRYTDQQQESYRTHLAGERAITSLVRVQEWLKSVEDLALPG